MDEGGEGDGEDGQADAAKPEVGDAVVKEPEGEADTGEKEDGEHALANGQEEVIGDVGAGRATEVLDGGVGVNLVAGPVFGVEAGHRDQEECPGPQGDEEKDSAMKVLAIHA